MKKIFKIFTLFFAICFMFGFSSCGEFFEPLPEETPKKSPTKAMIGIVGNADYNNSNLFNNNENNFEEEVNIEEEPKEEIPEPELIVSPALTFTEGTHIVENLLILCENNDKAAIYAKGAGTVVTINSGTYYGGRNGKKAPAIYACDGAKIIINGGNFYSTESSPTVYSTNFAYVEIYNGKFISNHVLPYQYDLLEVLEETQSRIIVNGGMFKDYNPCAEFLADSISTKVKVLDNGEIWYVADIFEK